MSFVVHVSTVIVGTVVEHKGKIALIQEAKEIARGKWNLPGGHLDFGERLLDGALREAYEETGLTPDIDRLLGVYTGLTDKHIFRFVFCGTSNSSLMQPVMADEVLKTAWFSPEEILAMPDEALRAPAVLRGIIEDYMSGKSLPLDAIREFLP